VITKKDIRAITKDNFITNKIARAILICARSRSQMYTEFLQYGALITFRRRVLHNEMSDNDKEIIKLAEWAIEEFGLPEVKDAGTGEVVGRTASADGTKQGHASAASGKPASWQVH
jgi:hypothetical protein